MYKIAYVIPYFGVFPKGFSFWLLSCKTNTTIDWLVFTDDKTKYDYPPNVKVNYWTFEQMQDRVQSIFDFKISLERPYKLCDYKPAYGEIFKNELKDYDFWGHCDIDLVWGNIRHFLTDDILDKFEKIGFFGHSLLYRNTSEVCARYRKIISGQVNYMDVYSTNNGYAFDEPGMDNIYAFLNIPVYSEIIFANLLKYDYGFYLDQQKDEDLYKNEHQIFTWKNGKLIRHYLYKGESVQEEFMYLHYWCRPTTFKINEYKVDKQYLIYADVTTDEFFEITPQLILKKSRKSRIKYYFKSIWFNRKKLTIRRIIFNIKGKIGYTNS